MGILVCLQVKLRKKTCSFLGCKSVGGGGGTDADESEAAWLNISALATGLVTLLHPMPGTIFAFKKISPSSQLHTAWILTVNESRC